MNEFQTQNHDSGEDFLRAQVTAALGNFAALRSGEIESFREYVGMVDDGESHPNIVNQDNVDEHEDRFRRQWARTYPDMGLL